MKKATTKNKKIKMKQHDQWKDNFPDKNHATQYIHEMATELAQIAQKYDIQLVTYLLEMVKYETKNFKEKTKKQKIKNDKN